MYTGIKLTNAQFDEYLKQLGKKAQQTRLEVIRKTAKVEIIDPTLEVKDEGKVTVNIEEALKGQKLQMGDKVIINGVPVTITGVEKK